MSGHNHPYHHPYPCRHCGGTNRITVRRTAAPGRTRIYNVPCNIVTRAQADADTARVSRRIGWTAFAAASIAAGVAITPATNLLAQVLQ